MRKHYTYDIAIRDGDGPWRVSVTSSEAFTRDPRSIARSLLERWINDHLGRLPGGRVFILDGGKPEPGWMVASVRVRVYRGDGAGRRTHPSAVAYLGTPSPGAPAAGFAGGSRVGRTAATAGPVTVACRRADTRAATLWTCQPAVVAR